MKKLLYFLLLALFTYNVNGQCYTTVSTGSVRAFGCNTATTINPFNTGRYERFNVQTGIVYNFNTCAASFDTRLYGRNGSTTGTVVFNVDDARNAGNCTTGLREDYDWNSTFTGVLFVSTAPYACGWTGTSAVLTYKQVSTVNNTTSTASISQCETKNLTSTVTHGAGGTSGGPVLTTASPTWSIVSGGGTIVGTTYTPATTGAKVLRATLGVCTSDVSFTVTAGPTAPTTISGNNTLCWGNSTTLTASGGTTTSDAVYVWNSAPCNIATEQNWQTQPYGTSNTTVNSVNGVLNVTSTNNDPMIHMSGLGSFNPSVYRYINMRYRVNSGTAGVAEIFFFNTAHTGAVGGESATGALISDGAWHILTIDMQNDLQYTTGGNITGWRYDWSSNNAVNMDLDFISLDENPIIYEGAALTVSPTVTSTYYASKRSNCGATSCLSQVVTLPTKLGNLGNNNESATCTVSENNWVHFYHSSGRLLASVNSGGQNLGSVMVTSYVDGAPGLVDACDDLGNPLNSASFMQRHWVITPTIQPISSVQVRLPFTNTELGNLSGASILNSNVNDNVTIIGDVLLSKYSGPNNVDNNAPNNCTALGGNQNTTIHGQTANGSATIYTPSVAAAQYIDYTIPSFSEFWLHGSSNNSPLPVELTSFTTDCDENGRVQLNWVTSSEHNASHFIIEKSNDAGTWEELTYVNAAGNSSSVNYYSAVDENNRGTNYYRLSQVDVDGTTIIYKSIASICGNDRNGFSLFPNPAKSMITIELNQNVDGENVYVGFYDVNGKMIKRVDIREDNGNHIYINVEDLTPGYYIVRLFDGQNDNQPVRFVKQ